MAPAVGSAAAGSGGVTGDAGAAVWGAVQLQPGVRAGGKRVLEISAEISHAEISFASEKIAAFSTSFYNDWLGSPEPSGGWSWHTLDGPQLERSGVFHRIL